MLTLVKLLHLQLIDWGESDNEKVSQVNVDLMGAPSVKLDLPIKSCLLLPSPAKSYFCRCLHILKIQAVKQCLLSYFCYRIAFYLPLNVSFNRVCTLKCVVTNIIPQSFT